MIDLGQLDRRATLSTVTQSQGVGGAVTDVYTVVGTFWLSQVTPSIKNIVIGSRSADQVESIFTSRWFDGLSTGMVFSVEGHTYRVMRLDELGRREGWRIYGRAVE